MAGLLCGKVQPAELQELAMMAEATQIASLCQDGEGKNGTDA